MFPITIVTWILILFGILTCLPLLLAQLVILLDPKGQRARDILIGKGEDWRDDTHFKSAYALACVDWIIFAPLFILSLVGIFLHTNWGYLLFSVSGAIQLYINTFLWFFEREYVYPPNGPLKYYTYIWGNFMYWGAASLLYGILRLTGTIL
jgi:hypothetical protein